MTQRTCGKRRGRRGASEAFGDMSISRLKADLDRSLQERDPKGVAFFRKRRADRIAAARAWKRRSSK